MTSWGVTLEHVTSDWGQAGQYTLEKISLQLEISPRTTFFPLTGPNHQGKSTLLYVLSALKWPTQGTVRWRFPNGKSFAWGDAQLIRPTDAVTLRRDYFGFAFQSNTLCAYLTAIENVAYPLQLQGMDWKNAFEKAQRTLTEILLLEEKDDELSFLHKFPHQLSSDQRQRIAIAQAIVHDPYVLFADELTELNAEVREQVMDMLKRWLEHSLGERCLIWVASPKDLEVMETQDAIWMDYQTCCIKREFSKSPFIIAE